MTTLRPSFGSFLQSMGRSTHVAIVTVGALLFLFPFAWLLSSAFKPNAEIFDWPPRLIPANPTLDNLTQTVRHTPVASATLNSAIIAGSSCLATLSVCSLAGYAFAKFPQAPFHGPLYGIVLGTMMIPSAVTLIPVYCLLMQLGWVNTYQAMFLPGAASGFGVFWLRQTMASSVPDELLDAARLDGCGEFASFWRIALPLSYPALAALAILVILGSWNNLIWAFVILQTNEMQTLPLLIFRLQDEVQTPYAIVMASSMIATLPLVAAFLFFHRYFIAGLSAGAIKS
jgi:ABC-type glycerol-3-phosphate transport system permease component